VLSKVAKATVPRLRHASMCQGAPPFHPLSGLAQMTAFEVDTKYRSWILLLSSASSRGVVGKLGLERLDATTLAKMPHADYYESLADKASNRGFSRIIALPLHDVWAPLAEIHTSLRRIGQFMIEADSTANYILQLCESTCNDLSAHWPQEIPRYVFARPTQTPLLAHNL